MPWHRSSAFWGGAAFAAFVCVFLVLGAAGWPGEPNGCTLPGGNCYCEAVANPPVAAIGKQPANTWSNLAPVLAGLAILVIADRERRRRAQLPAPARNPMVAGGFHPVLYGGLVLFLGPASMAFHGSLTRLGGWLDTLSLILFITFIVLYDAARVLRLDGNKPAFAGVYLTTGVLLGALTWLMDGSGILVFGIGVALGVVLELALAVRGIRGVKRDLIPWLATGLATFAIALVVWRLSWTDAPLCDPGSPLQGHAVWHLLAAGLAPFLFFLHFRTEIRT